MSGYTIARNITGFVAAAKLIANRIHNHQTQSQNQPETSAASAARSALNGSLINGVLTWDAPCPQHPAIVARWTCAEQSTPRIDCACCGNWTAIGQWLRRRDAS